MHVVERAAMLADGPVVDAETIRAVVRDGRIDAVDGHSNDDRDALRRVLERAGWNRTPSAHQLALHPITVYRRMKRLGIVAPSDVGRTGHAS